MLNIITCFEAGIEGKNIGLYRSLACYFQSSEPMRVFGVCPRKGHEPSDAAIREAERLGVTYLYEELNTDYADYPLANKPLVSEHIVLTYPGGSYLFIDSDTLFINPTDLSFARDAQAVARPVDTRNVGVSSFEDKEGPYWSYLYDLLGVDMPKRVEISLGGDIFEYYNSGLFHVADGAVFVEWRRAFEHVMEAGQKPKQGLFFVEQSVLSAVISSMKIDVRCLPSGINYPIHIQDKLPDRNKIEACDAINHIHYHTIFEGDDPAGDVLDRVGFRYRKSQILEFIDW